MRLRINTISLEGTSRRVTFEPGLNIITGPIACGKTTLFQFIRSVLGASLERLPREARTTVSAVSAQILVGPRQYSIVRPTVTTRSAMVDIASDSEALRLPLSQADQKKGQTYIQWLLDRLGLPRLEVPSAPTKTESEPTPVSLNDYLLYCTLTQDEIGFGVFGHTDVFKNIKRKYVFEIIYGIYSIETARIQDELRDVQTQLRELRNQDRLFSTLLKDTALENRAEIERNLHAAQVKLEETETFIGEIHAEARVSPSTETLQSQVLAMEADIRCLQADKNGELQAMENLERLAAQFETQVGKLTRSIVAHAYLSDIDFIVCPRCGANVRQTRADNAACYLCLQSPEPQISRDALIQEQGRIEAQLSEARDLLLARQARLQALEKQLKAKQDQLRRLGQELDFQTQTFVSSAAGKIASLAAERAEAKSRIVQLTEYLEVYHNLDKARKRAEELAQQKAELAQALESAMGDTAEVKHRIEYLEGKFNEILERFRPPEFGEEKRSAIDLRTYLPMYHGRKFDDLSSPGLATLVSMAYALAHQRSAIDQHLKLPNVLLIDGLSQHLGEEGLDPDRVEAIYQYLIDTSDEIGDTLQIIVIDNEVPTIARRFVRLALTETDRLIPAQQ